ncbi:alpha/beta fold hydrolase [Dactylosporangium sp. NPDC051484]|uniref:alpha/beta fold hydrolase n=1 Tax=Dactylosporangium sp. NPDC051484 TaxID=3154942 RepID=UPI00344B067D
MTLHFARSGSGEPLVLIHGIGHHWRAWEPVIGPLSRHHDVIALDLPGFGRSPASEANRGMPTAVAALGEFFAGLGLDRPHVAGNSLGGAIALELAAAGLARSVTALAPAGFGTAAQVRRALVRNALPAARHVTLDGCGHVPMSDDPGTVARIILETTAAVPLRSGSASGRLGPTASG